MNADGGPGPTPVRVEAPAEAAVPVLFDSPHSGNLYPDDFGAILDTATLRRSEDAFVDALFAAAPANGATLIAATFLRCYIDPNRADDDIDARLLDTAWPGPVNPSDKTTARSAGLIFGRIAGEHEIYARKLSVAEVRARIDNYWRPYHDAVAAALDGLHGTFGRVYHVNCHSMPARGNRFSEDGPVVRADFVLGDRDGTTCEPVFIDVVRRRLEDMGYWVKINDPMKGVELVRRYGDPPGRRHSLQIEVNRRLHLDEESIAPSTNFAALKHDLDELVAEVCAYARERA